MTSIIKLFNKMVKLYFLFANLPIKRPAGICGAAFVMAARLHGFKCSIEDITKIVKIGPNTIRKVLL